MQEFEDKSHHRLSLPLPKSKDGAPDDMEDDEEGEAPKAGQQDDEDSNDKEDTADLPPAL